MRLVRILAISLLVSLAACGGAPANATPPVDNAKKSGSDVERYFPLEEGRLYHYVTNEGGETGMLVAKVHRTDPAHGELRLSNATKRFVYTPMGIAYDTGIYVLKTPIAVGTSWPGEHGGTTKITSVDATVTVPAGSYASCVVAVEQDGRPPGSRYASTYCPGVGMVLLEVSAAGAEAKAELKSYGLPVKIE